MVAWNVGIEEFGMLGFENMLPSFHIPPFHYSILSVLHAPEGG
jgi:hypothetical protein